jgi:hypothetical protein
MAPAVVFEDFSDPADPERLIARPARVWEAERAALWAEAHAAGRAEAEADLAGFEIRRATSEGKGKLRGSASRPKPATPRRAGPAVAGWRPGGTAQLALAAQRLRVTSSGNDPHIAFYLRKPGPRGFM